MTIVVHLLHICIVIHVYLITRYAFPIKCTEVIYGDNPDDIVEIRAEYDPSKTSKPKVTGDLNLYKSTQGVETHTQKYILDVDLVSNLFRVFCTGLPSQHLELSR